MVRKIYGLCLDGHSPSEIAKTLALEGIKTAGGRERWYASTVKSILQNEKYKGDLIIQKTYISDYLTKKKVVNNGEVPKYYVRGNHEAIIDSESWDRVQELLNRPQVRERKRNSPHLFSGIIMCACCGGLCGEKCWHPGTPYEEKVFQCNDKIKKKTACRFKPLHLKTLKVRVLNAYNAEFGESLPEFQDFIAYKIDNITTDGADIFEVHLL